MDPEQWLLVIQKYLTVKFQIFFICAVIWMSGPKRMGITDRNRAFLDLCLFLCRRYFYYLFFPIFIFLFFCLGFFVNIFYYLIGIQNLFLENGLILRLCICVSQENLSRHERTILLQHFTCTVFIGKFQTLFIQKQRNLSTNCCTIACLHLITGTAITFPMYRFCTFFIRKRIDVYFICYHKC